MGGFRFLLRGHVGGWARRGSKSFLLKRYGQAWISRPSVPTDCNASMRAPLRKKGICVAPHRQQPLRPRQRAPAHPRRAAGHQAAPNLRARKQEHRLDRILLPGAQEDTANVILSASRINSHRLLRYLRASWFSFYHAILRSNPTHCPRLIDLSRRTVVLRRSPKSLYPSTQS